MIDGREVDITEEFMQVLRDGIYQDRIRAELEHRRAQRLGLLERKPNRKLGTTVASMPAHTFHAWEHHVGKGCWGDASERKSILKFAPDLQCKQEKLMDRVGATAKFGAGWERLEVVGRPTTREERLLV